MDNIKEKLKSQNIVSTIFSFLETKKYIIKPTITNAQEKSPI